MTLGTQYQLTRFSETHERIFTYLILDRDDAILALARRQLEDLGSHLHLGADTGDGVL